MTTCSSCHPLGLVAQLRDHRELGRRMRPPLPEPDTSLIGVHHLATDFTSACPDCGDWFVFNLTVDGDFDGFRVSDRIDRLPPNRAAAVLPPEAATRFAEELPTRLDRARAELGDPDAAAIAAWFLVRWHVPRNEVEAVRALLKNPAVAAHALVALSMALRDRKRGERIPPFDLAAVASELRTVIAAVKAEHPPVQWHADWLQSELG